MEFFAKIVKNQKPFTICAKTFVLYVWQVPEYATKFVSKVKGISFFNQFEYQR